MCRPRGSALILTLLILLVLTGLGMTALHSVGRSLHQSGAYRVRTQAAGLANAAVVYTAAQVGQNAEHYLKDLTQTQAADFASLSAASSLKAAQRGAYITLTQDPSAAATELAFPDIVAGNETGLLAAGTASGATVSSFEGGIGSGSAPASRFSIIIRDLIEGPPVPGYGRKFCFMKVTIAGRALVGNPGEGWEGAGMVGSKRAAVETYIGPWSCGAR
jgi:Tfp pilus assembly protein PilX